MEKGATEVLMFHYEITKSQYNALSQEEKDKAVFSFDHPQMSKVKKVLMTSRIDPNVGTDKTFKDARALIDEWGDVFAGVLGL